jgi:hypothetical protein
MLDSALAAAGVENLATVTFTILQRGNIALRVFFTGEHQKGAAGAGKASLVLYAVPANMRRITEEMLLHSALPQACAWLRSAQDAGNAWREADHLFEAHYSGNSVAIHES